MTYNEAIVKLEKYNQQHIMKYYEQLTEDEKLALLQQIDETDFDVVSLKKMDEATNDKGVITPLTAMQLSDIEERKDEFFNIGANAIKDKKVAAVLLAGGMGTRLGSDDPKGMYDVGITRNVYIFQRLIENLCDVVNQVGEYVHLFVMTSEKNNDATVKFFKEKDYFGYKEEYVHFFKQDMAPATDYEGKIYLEAKNRMATSPNGNGGWFSSMARHGMLDIVDKEGIQWLNVFSVDNVLQRIADPVFVGATIATNSYVGAKVVRKATKDEKVGVMCLEDGKPSIVEYYELTEDMMEALDEKGEPSYNYGVILNYLFNVEQLKRIVEKNLPLHIVEKKIPYINESGEFIKPEKENGYKFETLILDMIHMMDTCLPFEVDRSREFAPVKNKTGVDSVETARELLKQNGIEI